MENNLKIAVLGAGNGGQAMAAHLALKGFEVHLWNRSPERIRPIIKKGVIELEGIISGYGRPKIVTNNLKKALDGVEVIMVVVTADAHRAIAEACSPYLRDRQIIILNPGRTGGALEFRQVLKRKNLKAQVYVAEAQSLIYACRIIKPACVKILGFKEVVPVAALPATDTPHVLRVAQKIFSSFVSAEHVLQTSLENIGAIFHPAVAILNTAKIESSESFLFYKSMTQSITSFIDLLDQERLAVGMAFNLELVSAYDWISHAYGGVQGDTLYDRMRSNQAYDAIKAPTCMNTRLIFEDVPTGLVPIIELGKLAGVESPLIHSIATIASGLCQCDYFQEGRTLSRLGIQGMSPQELLTFVKVGTTGETVREQRKEQVHGKTHAPRVGQRIISPGAI